jgi:thiazole synthase
MAAAFRLAVAAGRAGYRAGLPAAGPSASASSPLTGFLDAAPPVTVPAP